MAQRKTLNNYFARQNGELENLQTFRDNYSAILPPNLTRNLITARMRELENTWLKAQANHEEILQYYSEAATEAAREALKQRSYFKEKRFKTIQEIYLETMDLMNNNLDTIENARLPGGAELANISIRQETHFQSKLPTLEICKFNGDYNQWASFRDMFTSRIASVPTVNNVDKLAYLKHYLTDNAANFVKGLTLTAENFVTAWDSLKDHYENPRILVKNAIHQLNAIKPVQNGKSEHLERLFTETTQTLNALKALGEKIEHWDCQLIYMTQNKLDSRSIRAWEETQGAKKEAPKWKEFCTFLENRIRAEQAFEQSDTQQGGSKSSQKPQKKINPAKSLAATATKQIGNPNSTPSTSTQVTSSHQPQPPQQTSNNPQDQRRKVRVCMLCNGSHTMSSCQDYLSKSAKERQDLIAGRNLCFNCLGPHYLSNCKSPYRCRSCNQKHHTTLHRENAGENSIQSQQIEQPQIMQSVVPARINVARELPSQSSVLLATAVVNVISATGEVLTARALLDQGSEVSLITEELAQRLGLPRIKPSRHIVGIGSDTPRSSKGEVKLVMQSRVMTTFQLSVRAYILPKLTGTLPTARVKSTEWRHLQGLPLADPDYYVSRPIDLLIGADIYAYLLLPGIRKGLPSQLVAQQTHLGWILSGCTGQDRPISLPPAQSYHCVTNEHLNTLVEKLWMQESSFPTDRLGPTREEENCQKYFNQTIERNQSGRYIVRLPFKRSPEGIGESRKAAVQCLLSLKKRMERHPELKEAYTKFLKEYEDLGHMSRAKTPVNTQRVYYLPHHGVERECSTTTKYRVVFNGSKPTDRGISLNDCLHEGPKLLPNLFDVITRWRTYAFVFAADVQKMFRQVVMHPADRDLQRILFYDEHNNIVEYTLDTVTYGTAAAPFLANATLLQLKQDEGRNFPLASTVIGNETYVDDVFSGEHSVQSTIEKVKQVDRLFSAGGFPLQKWISNQPEILQDIPAEAQESTSSIQIDDEPAFRALGLSWQQRKDSFVFQQKPIELPSVTTKRNILSRTAQLFDPLGWLAPVTVKARILLQDCWKIKLDWDQEVPEQIEATWRAFCSDLPELHKLKIPRWIGLSPTIQSVELHGFSDASKAAIGAVLYLRVVNEDNQVLISIIAAKTKVTPIQNSAPTTRVTIPRLELAAAALLTRLAAHYHEVLSLKSSPVHLWTDSTTTHCWIKAGPDRWRDFVRNRVALIHEKLPQAQWHHVPGADNPADVASRGISPPQLVDNTLWWQGPQWLREDPQSWPTGTPPPDEDVDLEEKTPRVSTAQIVELWDLIERYSNFTRLLRITAWCMRPFQVNATRNHRENQEENQLRILTPLQLESARYFWVKATQGIYFHDVIKTLRSKEKDHKLPNFITKLNPVVDIQGILRVGGRLKHSLLDPDERQPIILPRESPLTKHLLDHTHRTTLHGGTQLMLSTLRRRYWIIGGRVPVRQFIRHCVTCIRHRGEAEQQKMGQLPSIRVTPSRAFLNSGVDYAGPFTVKTWKGKNAKTYKAFFVVFVCMATSAVHLELTTDYTAEGFLAAFRRFAGRRGIPATVTSDCGTNFVGADRELRRLLHSASQESALIASKLADMGTKWSFNPPGAPHFGGKWEAAVKSTKFHLKRLIGESLLTYEEYATLLVQIEAVLNSRPLCRLTEDPEDLTSLTPGHFLIQAPLCAVPEPSLSQIPMARLSRWQLVQQMSELFWHRWSKEYLQQLQSTYKWHKESRGIQVGSIVLLIDERTPRATWPLARVTAVHPGADNLVRVVTIKTANTTFRRPIDKLVLLPIPIKDDNK